MRHIAVITALLVGVGCLSATLAGAPVDAAHSVESDVEYEFFRTQQTASAEEILQRLERILPEPTHLAGYQGS